MARKRPNQKPPERETAPKKQKKTSEEEFTGSVFKSMLKQPAQAQKALETFIRTAKKLPHAEIYDVVSGYVKISQECLEIFQLLEEDQRSDADVMLVLQALEMILLRTASDLSHLSLVSSSIVKKTLSSHLSDLLTRLRSRNLRFVVRCVSFLTALVSQGADAARDVFAQLQGGRSLGDLARTRDKSGRVDVRTVCVRFLLSFLMYGDDRVTGQMLEAKDLLPVMLSSGLQDDRLSTVNLILSTLRSRVVHNKAVTKTQKVRFFSGSVLVHIAALYRWSGVMDVTREEQGEQQQEHEEVKGRGVVRELVHDFLQDVCCSRKHGISFHDPQLGTGARAGNLVLLQFLVSLKQAASDPLVAELLVSVLKTSPDLLSRYLRETTFSFSPRDKSDWQENVALLRQIYEAQPEASTALHFPEAVPLPRLLSMVMVTSFPSVCNKAFFTQGLNMPSLAVQHTTLSLLAFFLKRAQKSLEQCEERGEWERREPCCPAETEEFLLLYRETLGRLVPDTLILVSRWQSLSKTDQGHDDAQLVEVKALLLQVMCLYQHVVPHLISQSTFDFSKLLRGVMTQSRVPAVLQAQILQLALTLPVAKFSWFHVQGARKETSVFLTLLQMFVGGGVLKSSTRALVLKVLRDTGVFDHTWRELEVWLDHLPPQQESVLQFVEQVLLTVVSDPHAYTEKVSGVAQEAGLQNDDVILQTFPFSAVVPAALESLDTLPEDDTAVCQYVCAVLREVLHSQRDPAALCLMLQRHHVLRRSSASFHTYCQRFLSPGASEPWSAGDAAGEAAKPRSARAAAGDVGVGLSELLQDAFTAGLSSFTLDSFSTAAHELLEALNVSRVPACVNQVLLYLRFAAAPPLPDDAVEASAGLMDLLTDLVLKLLDQQQDEMLLDVLRSVLEHPVLERCFLPADLHSLPPGPRRLSERVGVSTLRLLRVCAARLKGLEQPRVTHTYLRGVSAAVLQELREHAGRAPPGGVSPALAALLSLRGLMDAAAVKELLSALLLLPRACLVEGGARLSVYGSAVVELISDSALADLTPPLVRRFAGLVCSARCEPLLQALLKVLSVESGGSGLVPVEVLVECVESDTPCAVDLAVLLLRGCRSHLLRFLLWCVDPQNRSRVTPHNPGLMRVLDAALQRVTGPHPGVPAHLQVSVLRVLTEALQLRDGPSEEPVLVSVLAALIPLCGEDMTSVTQQLPAALQNPERHESWRLVDAVTHSSAPGPEWRRPLLSAALRRLSSLYRRHAQPQPLLETPMMTRVRALLVDPEDVSAEDWNAFVKTGLKCRYGDSGFLEALAELMETLYVSGREDLLPPAALHLMTCSHSLFLPTMLDAPGPAHKEALVCLLLLLVRACPAACHARHFPVLLGAYGASLSPADQTLLLLLQEYERNGVSFSEFPFKLWGRAAVEHHRARAGQGPSLWQKPGPDQLLSLLAADAMMNTVAFFPQRRRLHPQGVTHADAHTPDPSLTYDPCFLLPLFSFVLRPDSVLDCQKFVSCHAFGVSVAALSSLDSGVRAAAYHVLSCFHQRVDAAHFREQRQLLYLLDTLRNGIQKPNQRLSFLHASYVAKAAQEMLRPERHMSLALTRFLLGTQFLDCKRVPDFFKLFYSFDLEHRLERDWVLQLLREGLRDRLSAEGCGAQGVFQTLMAFSSSALADAPARVQVLEVLCGAARVERAAYQLVATHGVLSWTSRLLMERPAENLLMDPLLQLLHTLWFTCLGEKDLTSARCLPLSFISQFLCCLLTLLTHASQVTSAQLRRVLQTLCSVLRHHGTALSAHGAARWLTLAPPSLSGAEVRALLELWAAVTRDSALLSDLRDLACRRGEEALPGRAARRPGSDGKEQHERTECEQHLRNVLIHWEPKHPAPLDEALAAAILRWALRTLSEGPGDEHDTCGVLRWAGRVVVPRPGALEVLRGDAGVRRSLLRLYHTTTTTSSHTLELLSTLALALMPPPPGLHPALLETLRPAPCDPATLRESKLSLLELYVTEMLSGSDSPQLLLTHARMIRSCSRPDTPTSELETLCEAVLTAAQS